MLIIRNLRKRYGDQLVLEIDALTLSGGVYLIKGKNGSGKTTLFKSLSGIVPCEGNVSLDNDTDLHTQPLRYRQFVNYSEAEPIYPGFLTPIELMNFVGASKKATKAQQNELLNSFGIAGYQHKSFSTCSTGMVKKLSLSLAFLGEPKVIVLDEPLITLDDAARGTLIARIRKYVDDYGITCLISSHQEIDTEMLPLAGTYTIIDKKLVAL